MFIGHYGVSLAAKRYSPRLSLAAAAVARNRFMIAD